jgi:adenosine kinase
MEEENKSNDNLQGLIKYMSFGSPLMDIIADVPNEFVKKNNIIMGTSIHSPIKEVPWFDEFITNKLTYIPGGCQFNAMRVFNWMLRQNEKESEIVGFLGSVGKDNYSDIYQNLLIGESIIPIFEQIDDNNTGMCLVVCNNRERTHITDLGASTLISKEFLNRVWNNFKDVKLIFTELFIIKHQREVCFKLAKLGLDDNKIYGFNLPSDFFLKTYNEDILNLISHADVVFSNYSEAKYFCKDVNKFKTDGSIEDIIKCLVKLPKINKNKKRIFVITAGPLDAWCCAYDFKTEKITFCKGFSPIDIREDLIIDTNGAGDSFAGGFLSNYMKGRTLTDCMIAGHWASNVIIQQRGFQIPSDIIYIPNDSIPDEEYHE